MGGTTNANARWVRAPARGTSPSPRAVRSPLNRFVLLVAAGITADKRRVAIELNEIIAGLKSGHAYTRDFGLLGWEELHPVGNGMVVHTTSNPDISQLDEFDVQDMKVVGWAHRGWRRIPTNVGFSTDVVRSSFPIGQKFRVVDPECRHYQRRGVVKLVKNVNLILLGFTEPDQFAFFLPTSLSSI